MTNEDLHARYLQLQASKDQTEASVLKALLGIPNWDGVREAATELAKMWSASDKEGEQLIGFLLHLGIGHAQNLILNHNFHNLKLAENGIDPYDDNKE